MSRFAGGAGRREVAFESFAAESSSRLMRSAFLLCAGDRQLAEDLLQMTMMRTARRWGSAQAAPEAYARAVLVNLARDSARRRGRRVAEVLGETEDSDRQRVGADHAQVLAVRDAVLAALGSLPQRQREVIVLRFYADLSVADTAAAIGASEGTVMSHTSRALGRLRQLLGDHFENEETSTEHDEVRA